MSASAVGSTNGSVSRTVAVSCSGDSCAGGCRAAEPRRRRPRGQCVAAPRGLRAGRRRGRCPGGVPRAHAHGLPTRRTCSSGPRSWPRPASGSTRSRPVPVPPPRSWASRKTTACLYNSAAVLAHGAVQGIYRKHLLPNYSVFDEERYFEPWPTDGPLFVVGGVRVGSHGVRGRVEPVGSDPHAGGRRCGARSSTSTRRRTTRAGCASARRCSPRVPPMRRSRFSTSTSSADRTSSSSTAHRCWSTKPVSSWLARISWPRTSSSVDVDVPPAFRATWAPEVLVTGPRPPRVGARTPGRGAAGTGARGLRGARDGHPRLRHEERLLQRRHRALRRGRLVARRGDRGRRARSRPRRRSADAVARTRARAASPTPKHSPNGSGFGRSRSPSSPRTPRSSRCWLSRSRGSNPAWPRRTCRPASAARSS